MLTLLKNTDIIVGMRHNFITLAKHVRRVLNKCRDEMGRDSSGISKNNVIFVMIAQKRCEDNVVRLRRS